MLYPLKIDFFLPIITRVLFFFIYPCDKFIGINIINNKKNQKKLNDEIKN